MGNILPWPCSVESPACVTPKFICNDVIARLAKWRVLATTGVCASARTELKRQRFFCLSVYIIEHKTLRGSRAELQAACLSHAPVHCRLGTRAFFAPKCGQITVLCALLVWKLGPREAENGPKLSSTMYHLNVITVQYACSSRPSIACRHETWVIRAPKCNPMIVLCTLLVWRLGLREADDGPTLSSTMYHLYVITVQYATL